MTDTDARPHLYTIHGIGKRGTEWQEQMASIASSFFQCKAIEYDEFFNFGWLKVIAETLYVVLILFVCVVLWTLRYFQDPRAIFLFILAAALGCVCVFRCAQMRRSKAIDKVYLSLDRGAHGGPRPHIIAHSLGTYLLCEVLEKYTNVHVLNVIMCGSVVKRSYSWQGKRSRVNQVFNEIAGRDIWANLARFLTTAIPGMGPSGSNGFDGDAVDRALINPEKVRTGCSIRSMCCSRHGSDGPPCTSLVHNVRYPKLKHCDFFVGTGHMRSYWLPRLLGYDPALFRQFQEACHDCNIAWKGPPDKYNKAFVYLQTSCWGWAEEFGSLQAYAERQITLDFPNLWSHEVVARLAAISIGQVWSLTAQAANESHKIGDKDSKLMVFLDPRQALRVSTKVTTDEFIKRRPNNRP